MGWLFTQGQTRTELLRHLIEMNGTDGHMYSTIAHATRGNVLWTVCDHTTPDGTTTRFITCFLLARQAQYGWGYKDMTESMGPAYYSCPLSFLEMTPLPPGPYSAKWRDEVRAYHTRQARSFSVGEHVALEGCRIPGLTITSVKPLLGEYAGTIYRVPRQRIMTEAQEGTR